MGLEQLLGSIGRKVNEYSANVKTNWQEYSSGVKEKANQMIRNVKSTAKLMPDLDELRRAVNKDVSDGRLEDFVYAEEGIVFTFCPKEILPFNVAKDQVTYTLFSHITLEKGGKKFKTAKPLEVFFYNGQTVYAGTLVRKTGFLPFGKEYEAVRTAAAKALEKMRSEYCVRLRDYLTERWRNL